jgi:hypothetical protein
MKQRDKALTTSDLARPADDADQNARPARARALAIGLRGPPALHGRDAQPPFGAATPTLNCRLPG